MEYADTNVTWAAWLDANQDRDDSTKLAALREYITQLAQEWVISGEITGEWANKKLTKLGVATRIPTTANEYVIEAPITATAKLFIRGQNRPEAQASFTEMVKRQVTVYDAALTSDLVFTSGPEDVDPNTVDADAPTTVDDTLTMLREIVMLGNISGPRWNCNSGTNAVLASFGLAPLPERKTFTVAVPVEATMKTTVEAYDEDSASRVAGWRWNNGRTGYTVDQVTGEHPAQVVPIAV